MSDYKQRQPLMSEFIAHRKRDLMTLVTSTKKPEEHFAAQLAVDVLPIFYELIKNRSRKTGVDLIIYSAGGQVDAPWPLVNLIKEYYDDFNAIVPSRAHSAATLIALGANKICMSPLGSLSPIDPQLHIKPSEQREAIRAGIEDIYGYYLLIKDTLELDAQGRAEALKILAGRIGPEILGQASRIRNEIRIIATNLLNLHIEDGPKINNIVERLVEKLHSHQYMINRKEAQKIGLPVDLLDEKSETLSHQIIKSYIDEVQMDEPGVAISFGPSDNTKTIDMNRAFIETENRSFVFRTKYTFHKDGKIEKRINKWMEVTNS